MNIFTQRDKYYDLFFTFGPITIAAITFLAIALLNYVFDLPPYSYTNQHIAQNDFQQFGVASVNALQPIFYVSAIAAIPFLIMGLTITGLQKLRDRRLSKKTTNLQTRIKELRDINAKD